MDAPLPASALIHSATLVSAGILLLCKFNFLFILTNTDKYIYYIGAISAAYGGVVACYQTDIKKLLAYSTMSHCGFLWILISINNPNILVGYLFFHGIFKAATFLCVGSFIRIFGTQDIRLMGAGAVFLRSDAYLLFLCIISLCGMPLSAGYFYKTLLIDTTISIYGTTWGLG
jgi:NADH:ubiquinone oxidoreductase subunit 5 (subunit L)/multisubunit Na+/H+ antiporter MnhA subunit